MSKRWEGPGPGSPPGGGADLSTLTELATCEGSRQIAAFAARRAAAAAGADAALLFTPDAVQAGFVCTGACGRGSTEGLATSGPARPGPRARAPARPGGAPRAEGASPGLGRFPSSGRARLGRGMPPPAGRARSRHRGGSRPVLPAHTGICGGVRARSPLSRGRRPGARQGARRRAQVVGNAAGDRAPHEPLRPLQGVRFHDRPLRARRAHRPEGRGRLRLRDGLPLVPRRRGRRGRPRRDRRQPELRHRDAPGVGGRLRRRGRSREH